MRGIVSAAGLRIRLEPERVGDLLPVDLLGLYVPRDAPASGPHAGRDLAVAQPVVDRIGRYPEQLGGPLDADLPVLDRHGAG